MQDSSTHTINNTLTTINMSGNRIKGCSYASKRGSERCQPRAKTSYSEVPDRKTESMHDPAVMVSAPSGGRRWSRKGKREEEYSGN